ncbi:hypothetical protein C5B96_01695 [Subtercola sp. Z020]|uniref:hypothetical protein n=1 Tax=Subtercola sp. Z020 TaxID=2080582 RepID=UPI000CE7C920|nr:hypothetical protein [Subtercola sp. Z020]PPF89198.1 hypothetical protein C5B96_01695 [Subtercola sp. Z020]
MSNTGAAESEPTRGGVPVPGAERTPGEAAPDAGLRNGAAATSRAGTDRSDPALESVTERAAAERAAYLDDERPAGVDTVTIHRSPRYFRFMTVGAIAGLLVALILTFAFPEPPGFNLAQIFGFLGILFVVVGIVAGAVVALVVDRASRRRAKTIEIERIESVGSAPAPAPGLTDAAPLAAPSSHPVLDAGTEPERPAPDAAPRPDASR